MRIASGIILIISAVISLLFGVAYFLESQSLGDSSAFEEREWQQFQRNEPSHARIFGREGFERSFLSNPDFQKLQRDSQSMGSRTKLLSLALKLAFVLQIIAGIFLFLNRGRLFVLIVAILWSCVSILWIGHQLQMGGFDISLAIIAAGFGFITGVLSMFGADCIRKRTDGHPASPQERGAD